MFLKYHLIAKLSVFRERGVELEIIIVCLKSSVTKSSFYMKAFEDKI